MIPLLTDWSNGLFHGLSSFALDQSLVAASGNGSQAMVLGLGMVLCVVIASIACGVYAFARYRNGSLSNDADSMFRELCRTHDMTPQQRRLMKRLATGLKLSCPSALFIDSSLWVLPSGSDKTERLSAAEWNKLMNVQRTLFLPPSAKTAS